jgi:hypothetical protein
MSGGKTRKPESSFDVGAPGVGVLEPQRRERTAEDKAMNARIIAKNLNNHDKVVSNGVAAMEIAAAAEDRAGWITAKRAADAGVVQIRETVAMALEAATDATDAQARERLAGVEVLLAAAETRVAGASAAPEIRVPVLTCGDALLTVLPPLHIVGPVEPVYAAAESAIQAIFRSQMTSSDITAFHAIHREHQDHEIARRFGRFGDVRQDRLLKILDSPEVKVHARALETAQQQVRRNDPARVLTRPVALASEQDLTPAEPTPASNDAAGLPAIMDRPAPTEGEQPRGVPFLQLTDLRGGPSVQRKAIGELAPEGGAATDIARRVASGGGPLAGPMAGGSHVQRKPRPGALPVTAEPELRALLSQAITDHDIPRLQQRKAALLSLFQAIPTAERDALRARLHDKQDALGQLFQSAISTRLRTQLLATLDGAVVPASVGADSVDMAAFATTVQATRFHVSGEVVLDGAWRKAQTVQILAVPSFGPPADEPGPLVHWRLVDRLGERRSRGMVTWAPGDGAPPAIEVTIDQPGRWTVAIEIVDRGQVIAAIEKPILARSAAETGNDVPALLGGNDLTRSAEAMSDPQIGDQLGLLRAQMGKHRLGSLKPGDPTYGKMARAVEALQWQQHQRGVTPGFEPAPSLEARSFDASNPARRASIQRALDELIARHGIEGAKVHLHDLVVPPPGTGRGAGDEPAAADPHAPEVERILNAELELRRTEAASFLGSFEHQGRAIALGLLAESETRLRSELQRYGLKRGAAQDGSYGNQGPAGGDVTALRDAVDHGKQVRAAHERLNQAAHDRATGGTEAAVEQARKAFEATKLIAVAKHPMLKLFLDGETRQAAWAPTGSVPGPLDLGSYEAGHLGMYLGWELNKKLGDLHATRSNIADGTLSIFGVPKVVELVKANLHVAPGSVHDGIVNERAVHAHDGKDDSGVLALFTLALGLLLAVPTGGTSLVGAGIATAGEVTLLAADLYLLGKDFDQRNLSHAATNTDLSVSDALLQEEPEAGPIILRLLGVVGPLAGAAGVAKRVGEVAHVTRAREGIEAVRAVRRAAQAAEQVMTDPHVVGAVERLRPIAREAGMTDAEINALVRNIGRKGIGGAAHAATSAADATATVSKELAPQLARRLGVDEIEISGVAGEVGVHPTMRGGHVVAGKVVVGPSATVGDVLAHRGTVEMIERYNGLTGKVRETWDQIAEAVTGIERANPHAAFTGAHEAFAEVRKYEAMIRGRMTDVVSQLGHGGAAGAAAAASRLENEILVMEGELSHWRGVLEDVKRTGDPRLARGLIEAKDIGKVTDEAVAAGYPALPSNQYHYRRWPNGGGPEGQEFQVIRANASGPDPMLQPRRRGSGWVLEETEGTGKVPRAFEAALSDDHVVAGMFAESASVRAYVAAVSDPHGIALEASSVHVRTRKVIERVRTPRGATADQVAAGARRGIDEDNLRYALKAEFREEFFACAAREPTAEAQLARFRDITKDLNPGDRSSLLEDFLARRDPGSAQQVAIKQADHPHLGLTAKERHIDRVRPDGTAVEVKSIKGRLSTDDLAQLEDYKNLVKGEVTVQIAGKLTKIKRAMYEFTEPAGVRANLTTIRGKMLDQGVSVKVYNQSGHARILEDKEDLVGIEEWLAR